MKRSFFALLAGVLLAGLAMAGPGAIEGVQKQPVNISAIAMFLVFVLATLGITYWASQRTKSTSDFYTAGGGISGFQNGLAIAGDYMSAATLLGLTSMVYSVGFDGFIYAIGFFIGWPIILFLIAERLRNLGKFTFADIASYRLDQNRIRTFAALGSLTVVCFYLIVQMVGAGQLIQLLFGLEYNYAVICVGILMMVYVTFGGMVATTWVQIIKACLLLGGGTLLMILCLAQFGFSLETLFNSAIETHKSGVKAMIPGKLMADPISAISLSLGLLFGTAGLPHIMMRFFTVPNAKEARRSVFFATGFIGFFFLVVMVLGLAAITIVGKNPDFFEGGQLGGKLIGGGQHAGYAPGQGCRRRCLSRFLVSSGICHDSCRGVRFSPCRSICNFSRLVCSSDQERLGFKCPGNESQQVRIHRTGHPGHSAWHCLQGSKRTVPRGAHFWRSIVS